MYRILALNPGSTSTKLALFHDDSQAFTTTVHHPAEKLAAYPTIMEQYPLRLKSIKDILVAEKIETGSIDAFVGRGGLLSPIKSGTYRINDRMLSELKQGRNGEHASNLGAILAHELASLHARPCFIVDPVVVDEMHELARLSGHPQLPRKSIFHALNHKAVARLAANKLDKPYHSLNLIIAHMGGGISVAAHRKGLVIDVNNALDGEGPFSPERSGTLPAGDLARLCFSGQHDRRDVLKMIKGNGGVVAFLGLNDMRQVEKLVEQGDKKAKLILQAMAYQVAKSIAAQSAVLYGQVDAIVLTGGIAYDKVFVEWIRKRCEFLAPVLVFPGEREMQALALGALRVVQKEEAAQTYSGIEDRE